MVLITHCLSLTVLLMNFKRVMKTITNCVLSIKEIVHVVHVTLVKPNVMCKLHGMNKNPTISSEPSKHLQSNINHYFTWAVISNASKKCLSSIY